MKKSRLIVALAAVIIFAGLGLGVLAYVSARGTSAQASTLPDAAAWMPSSADFVAYFNLAAFLSSPLREEWETHLQDRALSEIDEFREKTGMDPWSDFRSLAWSTRRTEEGDEWGLALTGDLNPEALLSGIEERNELEQSLYQGMPLYVFSQDREHGKAQALAFPTPSIALFGSPDYVERMLDVGAGRLTSATEGPLAGWVNELPLDDTFWCAGSSKVGLGRLMARPNADRPQIPPLQSFAISGSLNSVVSLVARGKASDPEDATKIADVVRGFIALGSLQQQSEPDLQAVLESIQIGVVENKVEIAVEVPYEILRRLASRHRSSEISHR